MKPSALYRGNLWQAATKAAQCLGPNLAERLARPLAGFYGKINSKRRETVVQNLLPALDGNVSQARAATDRLFRNFGQKLADLWRYESGAPIDNLIKDALQWERFLEAQKPGRGTLLLTPHLGN